ncbi:MAG: HIT domain-containing protein [Euryarchaeota archaeon]|nr:HIT domain-containing protein [Euryarchaeota archaeon]
MEYIQAKRTPQGPSCFLCIGSDRRRDPEKLVVHRGSKCFVILNAYPYNNGHLMVSPYRHVTDFDRLTPEEMRDLMALTRRSIRALRKWGHPQGFNVGFNLGPAAGAGEAHIHQHIVPRWVGDTSYMPVLGETKMIVQHLRETYRTLRECF